MEAGGAQERERVQHWDLRWAERMEKAELNVIPYVGYREHTCARARVSSLRGELRRKAARKPRVFAVQYSRNNRALFRESMETRHTPLN